MQNFKIIRVFSIALLLLYGCNGKRNNESRVPVEPDTPISAIKPSINVYIENSGSMDGYVNGITEFEQIVYNYLSNIKISGITDSLNLFYINSQIIPYGSDIQDFIEKLEPNTFRIRGGNRQTSDISNVIKLILSETHENNISILVTDGIFSPGKGKDANQYLVNQQIGITNSIAKYAKQNPDATVLVYQLSSQFKGRYFNKEDIPSQIDTERPFYIWVIGDAKQVSELQHKTPINKFQGSGVQNVFSITTGNKSINYAVKLGSGKFNLDKKNPKTTITNWKKNSKGKGYGIAAFSINTDLSGFLLNDDYLQNIQNYELSDKDFSLSITKAASNGFGYTHSLNLSSQIIKKMTLSIKLKSNIPEWVKNVNDNDGSAPVAGKTYGIKYQIQGVYDAFTNANDCYTEIKIYIK
jgi:hypothetical protein